MEIEEQTERLRREITRIKAKGGRPHFRPSFRKEVAAWYQVRLAAGVRAEAACREIGLAANTLRRWAQDQAGTFAESSSETKAVPFVPVTVASSTAAAVQVFGPAGLRIEGLDLVALAELLRRLA